MINKIEKVRFILLFAFFIVPLLTMAQASGGQIRRQESKQTRVHSQNRRSKETAKPKVLYECRFATFNVQKIFSSIPEYTKAEREVNALQKKYENELKQMQDEFLLQNDNYNKEKKKLSKKKQQVREEQLNTMYHKIEKVYKEQNAALQDFSSKWREKLFNSIIVSIDSYKRDNNVYEMFSDNCVFYSNPQCYVDLTNTIINRMGGNAYASKPIYFTIENTPKVGYVYSEQIQGFNLYDDSEFQKSNLERLKRLSKMIAEDEGLLYIVDASQISNKQSEFVVNITYKLAEKFKQ